MPRVRRSRPLHSPEAPATEVRLHLTDMAHQGEALGRIDGQVAFISYGIPGEEVRVRVETEKRQYLTGVVSEVVTPSPHRVEPRCPHFGN